MSSTEDFILRLEHLHTTGSDALSRRSEPLKPVAATIAVLHGFDALDCPVLQRLSGHPGQLVAARTVERLTASMIGREVLVVFADNEVDRPIVVGVLDEAASPPADATNRGEVEPADEELIVADRKLTLRCGEASITLTRSGRVIIRGNYILSRSAGPNKLKGASIDIN